MARLYKKCPECFTYKDTTIVMDTVIVSVLDSNSKELAKDTAAADSLVNDILDYINSVDRNYAPKPIRILADTYRVNDSIRQENIKLRQELRKKLLAKNLYKLDDTIRVDKDHVHARAWQDGNKIKLIAWSDSIKVHKETSVGQQTTNVTEKCTKKFYDYWEYWLSVGILLLLLILALFKK